MGRRPTRFGPRGTSHEQIDLHRAVETGREVHAAVLACAGASDKARAALALHLLSDDSGHHDAGSKTVADLAMTPPDPETNRLVVPHSGWGCMPDRRRD